MYDHANDGESTKIGACSANYRRTNVATKLKITYIKDSYLNVSILFHCAQFTVIHPCVQVKIQYKACEWHECNRLRTAIEKYLFVGDDWTDCFTVEGITLPVAPYLGVTALTGDVSDNHEYVAWV